MVFVEVDRQGRLVLPKKLREEMGADKFDVEVEENKLIFVPVKKASELFGTLPNLDLAKFKKNHERER